MDAHEIEIRATHARRKSKLEWYEREIEKRWGSFVTIFRELRDDGARPYLATHENFEHYCEDRWGMTPRRVQQLLAADTVRAQLTDAAPELSREIVKLNERATREIASLPREKQVEILRDAIGQPGKLTADKMKQAKARVIETARPAAPAIENAARATAPEIKEPVLDDLPPAATPLPVLTNSENDTRSDSAKYQELLLSVERVFPNETRHQTALRYIREAEEAFKPEAREE